MILSESAANSLWIWCQNSSILFQTSFNSNLNKLRNHGQAVFKIYWSIKSDLYTLIFSEILLNHFYLCGLVMGKPTSPDCWYNLYSSVYLHHQFFC